MKNIKNDLLAFRIFILYNQWCMLLTPVVLRIMLVICLLGMALLAAFYLRRRSLSLAAYLGWGFILVFVPLLGPFLVILARPGKAVPGVP